MGGMSDCFAAKVGLASAVCSLNHLIQLEVALDRLQVLRPQRHHRLLLHQARPVPRTTKSHHAALTRWMCVSRASTEKRAHPNAPTARVQLMSLRAPLHHQSASFRILLQVTSIARSLASLEAAHLALLVSTAAKQDFACIQSPTLTLKSLSLPIPF